MLTFAVDDLEKRHDNLFPLEKDGCLLTESGWLLHWFDHYSIDYNTVSVRDATLDTWYCIGINFWSFDYDYLQALSDHVKEKLSKNSIRILFIYREADDPGKIRRHIVDMASRLAIDPELIWTISGNSQANLVPNSIFVWYFDCNYFFQTQNSIRPKVNFDLKTHNITCLSRVHKQWREWFVYNLCRFSKSEKNYISYGTVSNNDLRDFELWRNDNRNVSKYDIDIIEPDDTWRKILPLRVDSLDSEQHNQHSIVIPEHFQNSYWNIVLETLLDTEVPGGVFVTEKTLKPIRNGQSFVVLGCQGSLAFLREHGYQTFNKAIDESYDDISSLHERWYCVFEIAKKLSTASKDYLERVQAVCRSAIKHNIVHFQRSRLAAIQKLANHLDTI